MENKIIAIVFSILVVGVTTFAILYFVSSKKEEDKRNNEIIQVFERANHYLKDLFVREYDLDEEQFEKVIACIFVLRKLVDDHLHELIEIIKANKISGSQGEDYGIEVVKGISEGISKILNLRDESKYERVGYVDIIIDRVKSGEDTFVYTQQFSSFSSKIIHLYPVKKSLLESRINDKSQDSCVMAMISIFFYAFIGI